MTFSHWGRLASLIVIGGIATSCSDMIQVDQYEVPQVATQSDATRPTCPESNPLRNAYFGDLHVHTALSSDAAMYKLQLRPADAYRFAFGESVLLPPLDAQGKSTREVQIDRPLDFAAVTDHAEFLAEGALCIDPSDPAYASDFCEMMRESKKPEDMGIYIMNPWSRRDREVCGDDLSRCDQTSAKVWQEVIDAAETWNDPTGRCEQTTFIAYEWSSSRLGSNFHRNVIFRNSTVPRRPISYLETSREWELWDLLKETCLDSGTGCDVVSIPHNSNISNGRMFAIDYPGARSIEAERERAELRIALEPIAEIMQHKGDSECAPRVPGILGQDDALCDFEKFELMYDRIDPEEDTCSTGFLADSTPHLGPSCFSPLSYVRYALTAGLAEEKRLGVNPYKMGLMASTDTHNALAGGVEERSWPGHLGITDDTPQERVTLEIGAYGGNTNNGPGGLIGVWAPENSRDALFDAMQNREVFGTSGPRIRPRFFAGWDYAEDLCDQPELVKQAYAGGVPMGSDLPDRPAQAGAPAFVVTAERDVGTASAPGGLLQRVQVIKGWVDDDGESHQAVFDVAGGPNGASVDPATCGPIGGGHASLCRVWRDPEFDPSRRAVYYTRVLENPSCRYSAWQCLEMQGEDRPSSCDEPELPRIIQERAWSSPIWYTPEESQEMEGQDA